MMVLRATVVLAVMLAGGQAFAGGIFKSPYCLYVSHADVLVSNTNIRYLRSEVRQRYDHASEVFNDRRTVYSTSPLFVWAQEAKISCAQAYGYLRKRRKWRRRPDYETLQKCECFYDRMTHYLRY